MSAVIIGWVVLIYGILQESKLVEITNLTGQNNRATGFFGNINFYSSFVAIIMIINFGSLIDLKKINFQKYITKH